MLNRVLEPEIMDTEEDAVQYDAIPNQSVNLNFVEEVLKIAPARAINLIDLGCGPAHIPILFALKKAQFSITAVELADNMIAIAKKNINIANVNERVKIEKADAKSTMLMRNGFDIVISNSIVHHIHNPIELFIEAKRLASFDSVIYFKDLLRPKNSLELNYLVDKYAGDVNAYQRTLFHNSLHASLTLDEIIACAKLAELPDFQVEQTSDRHWTLISKIKSVN